MESSSFVRVTEQNPAGISGSQPGNLALDGSRQMLNLSVSTLRMKCIMPDSLAAVSFRGCRLEHDSMLFGLAGQYFIAFNARPYELVCNKKKRGLTGFPASCSSLKALAFRLKPISSHNSTILRSSVLVNSKAITMCSSSDRGRDQNIVGLGRRCSCGN